MAAQDPIGLFDSGVGGLSIMKEIRRLLPNEDLIYVADSKYCPYGEKTPSAIQERAGIITEFLLTKGVKLIVVACNTASVAALEELRTKFILPFIGVEPAVKQAALFTKNQKIGVLATGLTLSGERFTSLVQNFGGGLTVVNQACPGLVEKVEAGEISGPETERMLKEYLQPLQAQEVDVVVLGCTHYPFLRPLVEKIVAPGVRVIDTGEPVARQTRRVLAEARLLTPRKQAGKEWFYTSGDPLAVGSVIERLWGDNGEGVVHFRLGFQREKKRGGNSMLSDIEIAQQAKMRPIAEVAAEIGLGEDEYEPYGRYKAKVDLAALKRRNGTPDGKLIYVTAITPTPAGEGKTCTAVGLTQALGRLGKKVAVALREPSLGPTFGVKGGAAGGGYAQVLPMDEINLHFTGDIHAVTAAHNLLAAVIDNHIYQGNDLGIDPKRVLWQRVIDISDRELRHIIVGLGAKSNGIMRESGFDITVASEIMAILCLSADPEDLKQRLGAILVAYTYQGKPVFARDLGVVGALAVLLKEALKPNLVQTLEGQPAFIHGGPFANIAHGNNSILATKLALKLADYVVTEGGFASDLGAEKFFDLVAPEFGIKPAVVVLVASVRALKSHGGVAMDQIAEHDPAAVSDGLSNLAKHLSNLREVFNLPVVVALNKFPTDDPQELAVVLDYCRGQNVPVEISEVVAQGAAGGINLAQQVLAAMETAENRFAPLYDGDTLLEDKITLLATKIYGADGVTYTKEARKALAEIRALGFDHLPVCMAKTQMSLSDNPKLKGAPQGWELTVRDLKLAVGAGFIVALAGNILTMPGLPKTPAAQKVDLLPDGSIVGLF